MQQLEVELLRAALDEAEARRLLERADLRRRFAFDRAGLPADGTYELDVEKRTVRRIDAPPTERKG